MFRKLVEDIFGDGAWEDVDHDEVERQLEAEHDRLRVDFERADEYPYDHYTDAMEDVKQLKRERRHDDVEDLLLWCIDFLEAEATHKAQESGGVPAIAPAYYRHLAIVYRKDNQYDDEVGILERYHKACEKLSHPPRDELQDRLDRARELAAE